MYEGFYFIKLFFWQSEQLARKNKERHYPTFEKGIELANRYEEQYGLCQTEEERQELYWNTLYLFLKEGYYNQASLETRTGKDFLFEYIQNPPEFIEREDNQQNNRSVEKQEYQNHEYPVKQRIVPFIHSITACSSPSPKRFITTMQITTMTIMTREMAAPR